MLPDSAYSKEMSDSETHFKQLLQTQKECLKPKNDTFRQMPIDSERQSRKDRSSTQSTFRSKSQKQVDETIQNINECPQSLKNLTKEEGDQATNKDKLLYSESLNLNTLSFSALIAETNDSTSTFDHTPHKQKKAARKNLLKSSSSMTVTPAFNRRRSKKISTNFENKLGNVIESEMLFALRGRLEKIKELKVLIKGYEILLHYANLIDSFNEYGSGIFLFSKK